MGKTKQATTTTKKTLLDEKPEGLSHLRLRNTTTKTFEIPGGALGDLHLAPQMELVIPGEEWSRKRSLRNLVYDGSLEAQWVDVLFEPRNLPSVEEAPDDARPDNPIDRAYAREIVVKMDEQEIANMVNAKIVVFGTDEPNVSFYKLRMMPILRLALWMEKQVQNRAKVVKLIDQRMQWIRAL